MRRYCCPRTYFYPRPPRGGRLQYSGSRRSSLSISIHALREEGDRCHSDNRRLVDTFLSTPSARRATGLFRLLHALDRISIHALREEGDGMPLGVEPSQQISIHALREEGDNSSGRWATRAAIFLSTPSARRATVDGKTVVELDKLFLSTPSARRATACQDCPHHFCVISIHALREEGDHRRRTIPSGAANFYPRPPRGGRQEPPAGDQRSGDFYPRPPRGGRLPQWSQNSLFIFISIHALREEGDVSMLNWTVSLALFLSTPSARRATAKTETKSLFSNKLYNILHEFRRALIYNGSKSYPNHAK